MMVIYTTLSSLFYTCLSPVP